MSLSYTQTLEWHPNAAPGFDVAAGRALAQISDTFHVELSKALEGMPLTVFIQDSDLQYIYGCNEIGAWKEFRYLGLRDDTLGAMPPAAAERLIAIKREVIATGGHHQSEEWRESPRGDNAYIQIDYQAYTLADGTTGIYGRVLDLTKVRHTSDAIAELHQRLRTKINLLQQADLRLKVALEGEKLILYMMDENLRYIWLYNASPPWMPEHMLGRTDYEIGLSKDQAEALYTLKKHTLETGLPGMIGLWVDRPDGQPTAYYEVRVAPHTLEDGSRGLIGKALELTLEKSLQEELSQANQVLEQLNASLNEKYEATSEERLRLSIENEQSQRQLDEARTMQHAMLPHISDLPPQLDVVADMETSLDVGGDYFDYTPIGTDGLTIAIGDATGHGVQAGLVVASVKSYFQILGPTAQPKDLLEAASRGLAGMRLPKVYMALTVARFIPGYLVLSTAGMPPLLMYCKATRKVEQILTPALFLGTDVQKVYSQTELVIEPGDIFLFLTDGYTETRNEAGDILPMHLYTDVLAEYATQPLEVMKRAIRRARQVWRGSPDLEDDASMMIVRVAA